MDMGVDKSGVNDRVGLGTDQLRFWVTGNEVFRQIDRFDAALKCNGEVLDEVSVYVQIIGDNDFHL